MFQVQYTSLAAPSQENRRTGPALPIRGAVCYGDRVMFKFLHAADVHLDSPLKGLERYEGSPADEIRGATRRALERLVDLAIGEEVALVLLAGDLYDGQWRDYNTGLFFIAQMTRLREAGIRVYLVAGNHDAANRTTRWLQLPEGVTLFSSRKPETAVLEDLHVAVHGQSFAAAAVFDDLAEQYPAPRGGCFNIGLLHTSATGSAEHERYAPCTLDTLRSKQYDYWALGHVHRREVLCREPFVAFSGNLQGRHIRESGPKGCLLVTVDDDQSVRPEFRPLDVLRWERAVVDAGKSRTTDELLSEIADRLAELHGQSDGRLLAVRVELVGESAVHETLRARRGRLTGEIRSQAIQVGGGEIWVEKILVDTSPPRGAKDAAAGPLAELADLLRRLKCDAGELAALDADFSALWSKLPVELKEGPDAVRLDDPDGLRPLLDDVEPLLAGRLLGKDAAP